MRKWIVESIAMLTGAAVSGVILETGHAANNWLSWLLGVIIFGGIFMVVENAGNGAERIGLAFEQLLGELESRLEAIEGSIREIERSIDRIERTT
jgi:hypothetical protein